MLLLLTHSHNAVSQVYPGGWARIYRQPRITAGPVMQDKQQTKT